MDPVVLGFCFAVLTLSLFQLARHKQLYGRRQAVQYKPRAGENLLYAYDLGKTVTVKAMQTVQGL